MIYDHGCNGAEMRGNFGDVSLSFPMSRRIAFPSHEFGRYLIQNIRRHDLCTEMLG